LQAHRVVYSKYVLNYTTICNIRINLYSYNTNSNTNGNALSTENSVIDVIMSRKF